MSVNSAVRIDDLDIRALTIDHFDGWTDPADTPVNTLCICWVEDEPALAGTSATG